MKVRDFACKSYLQISHVKDEFTSQTAFVEGLDALILRESSTHARANTYTRTHTSKRNRRNRAILNFNHKNALSIVPTVGGSKDGVGATRVDNACCWMDMSREAAGVKVKSERVRKGGPTFEWKRLERSRGTETRESEKRNVDG